jgi:hypothetical protein
VSFAAITLSDASQRVFIVVSVYFVIDSVRKLLDTPSYIAVHYRGMKLFPNSLSQGIVFENPSSEAESHSASQ